MGHGYQSCDSFARQLVTCDVCVHGNIEAVPAQAPTDNYQLQLVTILVQSLHYVPGAILKVCVCVWGEGREEGSEGREWERFKRKLERGRERGGEVGGGWETRICSEVGCEILYTLNSVLNAHRGAGTHDLPLT